MSSGDPVNRGLDKSPLKIIRVLREGQQLEEEVRQLRVNTSDERRRDHVLANLMAMLPQVERHDPNPVDCCIVGGGPTLTDELGALRDLRNDGAKVIATNGSYDFLLDHGITPSAHVVLDARPTNARFVQRPREDVTYFLASQVHPDVTRALMRMPRVYQFHCYDAATKGLLERWFFGAVHIQAGGSTVGLRSFVLARLLGFMRFHMFGLDSCCEVGNAAVPLHHAYDQPENDRDPFLEVDVNGRRFVSTPWMVSQAEDLVRMIVGLQGNVAVKIYGDGLLSHLLTECARLNEGEADGEASEGTTGEAEPSARAATRPARRGRAHQGTHQGEDFPC